MTARAWHIALLTLAAGAPLAAVLAVPPAPLPAACGARQPEARPARGLTSTQSLARGGSAKSSPVERAVTPVAAAPGRVNRRLFLVTAYSAGFRSTGKRPDMKGYGLTASGKRVRVGMCAADKSVPFGTVFVVPGYGRAVVEDRGGAIKGNHIDVYFERHSAARAWGVRRVWVTREKP